jgi:hypothetical protein
LRTLRLLLYSRPQWSLVQTLSRSSLLLVAPSRATTSTDVPAASRLSPSAPLFIPTSLRQTVPAQPQSVPRAPGSQSPLGSTDQRLVLHRRSLLLSLLSSLLSSPLLPLLWSHTLRPLVLDQWSLPRPLPWDLRRKRRRRRLPLHRTQLLVTATTSEVEVRLHLVSRWLPDPSLDSCRCSRIFLCRLLHGRRTGTSTCPSRVLLPSTRMTLL